MARDLHDTVIQRLFALGLTLQGIAARLPDDTAARIATAVSELDHVITQVRATIYELGMGNETRGARDEVRALVRQLRTVVGFDVPVSFEGPVDTVVDGLMLEHLLATVREGLTNLGKHAEATQAAVTVAVDGATCRLIIADDGVGMGLPAAGTPGGLGLRNLRQRAEKLGGTLSIEDPPGGGTVLTWAVPLDR